MKLKTLDLLKNIKGKRILVRSDLNSVVEKGKVIDSDRIKESAETIKELKRKGARIVVLAHQSRPRKKDFLSLEQHAKLLNKYVRIKFVKDVIGNRAQGGIDNLINGEVLLLDNVRTIKDEFRSGRRNKLVRALAGRFDYYVNDAFSVCHREQSSIVDFPRVMPSFIGRLVENELKNLEKIRKKRETLFILGGAKAKDNIILMKNRKVITCGIFGHLCLIAKGLDLGAQNKFLKKELDVIPKLKKVVLGARTPIDLAVRVGGKRRELAIDEFPSKYEVYDIGPRTIELYKDLIGRAGAIFMKGTAGFCEEKKFCKGTEALLRTVARNKGVKVLGGGHLSTALQKLKISKKKFDFVSLSGGATVWYLTGRKLPGLEALKNGKR